MPPDSTALPNGPGHDRDAGVAETAPGNDPQTLIRLQGVSKHFGSFAAVDDVSFDIHRGEVFGLIGHNGAGKSTLFKMMLGLLAPTEGRIDIAGESVAGPQARNVRQKIGYLPENIALWDNLSGLETLRFFARLKHIDTADCPALLEKVGLGHAGDRPVRAYSKGMRQRLGFAQALQGNPHVLFLDEPTTGLDPRAIHFFWDTLAELREQGLTIVLTSHILAELQHRVDRVAVMTNGRVEAMGSLAQLRERFDLPLRVEVKFRQPADTTGQPRMPAATLVDTAVPPPPGTSGLETTRQGADADLIESLIARLIDTLPAPLEKLRFQRLPDEDHRTTLLIAVPRPQKMLLMQHLMQASLLIADIHVEEPSLEDMFFSDDGDTTLHPPDRRPA
ncbi:MAG: ABC transporter ATP-binding protein [Lautropia sp.]|nr:ABC transporter ATP-binding protein [Lautropia sp.]